MLKIIPILEAIKPRIEQIWDHLVLPEPVLFPSLDTDRKIASFDYTKYKLMDRGYLSSPFAKKVLSNGKYHLGEFTLEDRTDEIKSFLEILAGKPAFSQEYYHLTFHEKLWYGDSFVELPFYHVFLEYHPDSGNKRNPAIKLNGEALPALEFSVLLGTYFLNEVEQKGIVTIGPKVHGRLVIRPSDFAETINKNYIGK